MLWHPISEPTFDKALLECQGVRWTGSDHDMAPDRLLLGTIAEMLVAHVLNVACGRPIVVRKRAGAPDGGQDFGDVDVKAIRPDRRELMRLVASKTWTTWYVAVVVDLEARRAGVLGHTHVSELQAAPVKNIGYGDTYCLPLVELEPGLPPSLVLASLAAARA